MADGDAVAKPDKKDITRHECPGALLKGGKYENKIVRAEVKGFIMTAPR